METSRWPSTLTQVTERKLKGEATHASTAGEIEIFLFLRPSNSRNIDRAGGSSSGRRAGLKLQPHEADRDVQPPALPEVLRRRAHQGGHITLNPAGGTGEGGGALPDLNKSGVYRVHPWSGSGGGDDIPNRGRSRLAYEKVSITYRSRPPPAVWVSRRSGPWDITRKRPESAMDATGL